MPLHEEWFRSHAHEMSGGGLWLSGAEPNRLEAHAWETRKFRVLISRLSTWKDTLESFTHRILYAMLRDVEGVFPDMSWVPSEHDGHVLSEAGVPWLLGSGTRHDVLDFDVLAFSNALVQETINIPVLLERSGVPVSRRERAGREDLPIVLLGGANALYSSALFGEDSPLDVVFVGEEPSDIQRLFCILRDGRAKGLTREERIQSCLDVPGTFLPDNWSPTTSKHHGTPELNRFKTLEPIPAAVGVAGTASLQISEGCPYFCSFCAESWSRKPYREVTPDSARATALEMKRELGLSSIDLYSFNFNTYEHIRPLVGKLLEDFGSVGLKSQRFDAIAHDPTFVRLLQIAGKTSITCGLEGISTRMRSYLQKDLSDTELDRSLDALLRARLRELKIFVIVTGLEEQEDLDEFKVFLLRLKDKLRRAPSSPRTMVSATPLVRFPWTPLEFEDMSAPKPLSRMCGFVKNVAVQAGFEFRGSAGVEEAWVSQVLVRARGPEILDAAREAQRRTGFVFREEVSPEYFEAFRAVLAERGIDPDTTTQGYDPTTQASTPWENLDPGVSRRFLKEQWKKCLEHKQTPVCLGWVDEKGPCQACGACSPAERDAITHARTAPRQDLDALEIRIRELRRSETLVPVEVELAPICQGLPRDLVEAWHARAWLQAFPELVSGYRRHESDPEEHMLATGRRVLTPVFIPGDAAKVREMLSRPEAVAALQSHFAPYGRILGAPSVAPETFVVSAAQPIDPGKWLAAKGLKHTFRRDGEGKRWELAKESIKKRIAKDVTLRPNGDSWSLVVSVDEKFDAREFLRTIMEPEERHLHKASWE